jgi:hypothetical protein
MVRLKTDHLRESVAVEPVVIGPVIKIWSDILWYSWDSL